MKPLFKISQDLPQSSIAIEHENLDMNDYTNRVTPLQTSVCTLLFEQRNKLGITLTKVSEELRIAEFYLHAIEQAHLEALPERAYTLGFIRSYAQYLKLDTLEIIQRFKTEVLGDAVNTNYSMPKPVKGNALPNRWLIWSTSIIVVCGIILGWIYYTLDTPALNKSHAVPSVIQNDIIEQTQDTGLIHNIPIAPPQRPETTTTTTPVAIESHTPTVSEPVDQTAVPTSVFKQSTPDHNVAGDIVNKNNPGHGNEGQHIALPASGHIQFKFTALSWIEIRDEYGTTIVNRNFKAGEYYNVQLKPGLVFSTGNAGGINVVSPSNQTYSMGKPGEVLHNVSLNTNRFQTNF